MIRNTLVGIAAVAALASASFASCPESEARRLKQEANTVNVVLVSEKDGSSCATAKKSCGDKEATVLAVSAKDESTCATAKKSCTDKSAVLAVSAKDGSSCSIAKKSCADKQLAGCSKGKASQVVYTGGGVAGFTRLIASAVAAATQPATEQTAVR